MKVKPIRWILLNAVLVLSAFFLIVLPLDWIFPGLAALDGMFARAALATLAALALIVCAADIAHMLRAGKQGAHPSGNTNADTAEAPGSQGTAETPPGAQ